MSSAEYSYKLFKTVFAYRPTWTLIRLVIEEQSDLGPHCKKWLLKSQADDKADDHCCNWQFKGWYKWSILHGTEYVYSTSQLAFYVNLHRAVIGPSATLTGRWRPDIDLHRMLTGLCICVLVITVWSFIIMIWRETNSYKSQGFFLGGGVPFVYCCILLYVTIHVCKWWYTNKICLNILNILSDRTTSILWNHK